MKQIFKLLALLIFSINAYAAPVDITGFEWGTAGDIAATAGTTSVRCETVGSISPRTGRCAGRVNPSTSSTGSFRIGKIGSSGNLDSNISSSNAYYEFYFAFSTAPGSSSEEMFVALSDAGSPARKASIRLNSSRQLAVYNAANTLVATGSTVLSTNTWYRIRYTSCTGASCSYALKVNNTAELSGTGNFGTDSNGSAVLGKYTNSNSQTVNFWYDDFIADDSAALADAVDFRVKALLPNEEGAVDQFKTGPFPSDWSSIATMSTGNGVAIPTTSYILNAGAVTNQVAQFNVQNRVSKTIVGAIKAVKAVMAGTKNTSGQSLLPIVRISSNGDNTDIGGLNPTTDSFVKANMTSVSPDTGSAYTLAEIDSLQIGVKEGTVNRLKVTSLLAMVGYDAAATYSTPTPAPTFIAPTAFPTPPASGTPPYVKIHPNSSGYADGSPAGSGRNTTSTTLYQVSSLADSGAGTLRQCMEASGERTCVFEIAGYIDLHSDITVDDPYLTVAGQTAPNPGIHLRNGRVNIKTHDVLLNHFSIRPGDAEDGSIFTERDAVNFDNRAVPVYNIVLDHMSLTYAMDENISFENGPNRIDNISITNSIIGQSLNNSIRNRYFRACTQAFCDANSASCTDVNTGGEQCTDYKAPHSHAGLITPITRLNFNWNLVGENAESNMRTYGGVEVSFLNNLVYGWGGTDCAKVWNCSDAIDAAACKFDIVGNYFRKASYSSTCPILYASNSLPSLSKANLFQNICGTRPSNSGNEWACSQWNEAATRVYDPPFALPGIITNQSPDNTFNWITLNQFQVDGGIGARPFNRYTGDTAIINNARNDTGALRDCITNCDTGQTPVFGTVGTPGTWPNIGTATRTLTQLDVVGWNKDAIESNGRTALENYIFSFNSTGSPTYTAPGTPTPTPVGTATNTPVNTATPTRTPTPTNTVLPANEVPFKQAWKDVYVEWSQRQYEWFVANNGWSTPDLNGVAGQQLTAHYYDATVHNFRMNQLLGTPNVTSNRIAVLRRAYRDNYVLPNNGNANGYTVFTSGLRKDYEINGNTVSRDAVYLLSRNAAFNQASYPLNETEPFELSRENAYRIIAELDARALGYTARPILDSWIDQALGHLDQFTVAQTADYIRPFMVAISVKALIQVYEEYPSYPNIALIQPAIQAAYDKIWDCCWVPYSASNPNSRAFRYTDRFVNDSADTDPTPDLNGLILPPHGWLYKQTLDPKWRVRGDEVFRGSIAEYDPTFGFWVRGPYLGPKSSSSQGKKQFNQTYQWSSRYIEWAEQPSLTPTVTPTPTLTPTVTPSPTITPTPTATSTPTATYTPGGPTLTPTPTSTSTPTVTPGGPTAVPTVTATTTPIVAGYTPGPLKRRTPNFPFEPCNPICCDRGTCPPECGANFCG